MVRKQRVSIDKVQLTLLWEWEAKVELIVRLRGVKAEQIVQPFFDWILLTVSNRLIKASFQKSASAAQIHGCRVAFLVLNSSLVLLTKALQ